MAKTKLSRKELLKGSDEFLTLSSRAVIFAREHARLLEYLGMVLAGLVVIGIGINAYLQHINKEGQNAYNRAFYALSENIDVEGGVQDLKEPEALFKRVIDEYSLSKASLLAIPELAYVKYLKKEYDSAITLYQEFLNKASRGPYQSLAMLALAVCYEEKGDYDKAISTLEEIRKGPDDFFKEQGMLSLARIYRLAGREDKSKEVLEEFIDRFQSSSYLPLAEAYLNQE